MGEELSVDGWLFFAQRVVCPVRYEGQTRRVTQQHHRGDLVSAVAAIYQRYEAGNSWNRPSSMPNSVFL